MLAIGVLVFIFITLVPGFLVLRLLRIKTLPMLNVLLYVVGLGLMFNLIVGAVSNFTFGIRLMPIVGIYIALFIILCVVSCKYGNGLSINWRVNWKSATFIIPVGIYLLALGLQFQTILISPYLIGTDIHLEYYYANMALENGYWNPIWDGSPINSCLGLVILLPLYSLLTGMELVDVFRIISPLIFAFLPLALYGIFKMQFGTVVAVLSVVFFVTMPMFTMDLVQLIRQQQSELFFILVVLLLMDDNLSVSRKIILGAIFSAGVVTTYYGLAVGYIGYLVIGSVIVVALGKLWREKIDDAKKPLLRWALIGIAFISLFMYVGYYSSVVDGNALVYNKIPVRVFGVTTSQPDSLAPTEADIQEADIQEDVSPILKLSSLVNPFLREPLVQTAIGLDFARASTLGKIWRVLQYFVEICLVVGLVRLLLRPNRKVRIEYVSFIITSFFVIVGIFLLFKYSYGMGATRVWQVTLLFMSPLFVIGASTIGEWLVRLKRGLIFNGRKLVIISTLVILVPYFVFNSGIVYELAKSQPVGFIDVPYSIALSGHRVDIASIFEKEDIEALDWFEEYKTDKELVFADVHGLKLLIQRFGLYRYGDIQSGRYYLTGTVREAKYMNEDDTGYIFLRKWNVDNNLMTYNAEYASRLSYPIDELELVKEKIERGRVIFDNGAKILVVE